jgi:hypothetical protein
MSLLDGALAAAFSGAFSGLYLDATLYRPIEGADDGSGGGVGNGFDGGTTVKAQLDSTTQAMRDSPGYVDTDQRIIVLATGVDPIDADCEIEVSGQRWSIASVAQDPCKAYYELRGRLAGAANNGS